MSIPGPNDPWSPYPVQDWQQLPGSPPAPPPTPPNTLPPGPPNTLPPTPSNTPPPTTWVDPRWAPPPSRPRWPPYLIVGLVCALVAGGFFAADRLSDPVFSTAAQEFVPDDGAVQYSVRQTTGAPDTPYVTESARLNGVEIFTSLDYTFGTSVLTASGLDVDTLAGVPFWRTTTTQIGGTPESSQQLVRVYRVDGPVTLLGESGPGVGRVFTPGLVELPADVRPGSTWSSEGSAGQSQTYRSEFRAEAAERGCLRVTGTITYADADGGGKRSGTTTVDRGWCVHEGLNRDRSSTGGSTVTDSAVRGPAAPPSIRTTGDPVRWGDPRSWREQAFTTVSIDQNFGQGMMTGSPSGVPPVMTASGLVVRPTTSSDVVVFTNKTPSQWASLWRMRPGGTVISLTAFGDVVVVTTSERRVVGYSVSGVRLWQHELDEVAYDGPVRVDDGRIALVDNAGTVRVLDAATGRQRWQQELRAEVKAAPVADARAVVIADGRGNLTAFAPDDGSELWQNELDVSGATITGDTLVTYSAATLTAVSIEDGSTRWMEPLAGTVDALTTFDGRVVLATQISTTIRGEDGVVQKVLDPYVLLTVTTDHLAGWGNERADVLDRRLAVVRTMDTADRNLTTAGNWPVAERSGVMLFAGDWSFQTWSEQT